MPESIRCRCGKPVYIYGRPLHRWDPDGRMHACREPVSVWDIDISEKAWPETERIMRQLGVLPPEPKPKRGVRGITLAQ